jgi:hypothetical protein
MEGRQGVVLSLLFSCAVVVAACGGGGGGGGSSSSGSSGQASGPAAVSITAANATSVSSEVSGTNQLLLGSGEQINGLPTGAVVESSTKHFNLVGFSHEQIERLTTLQPQSVVVATGVAISQDIPCELGGSISYVFNDNDGSQLFSTGDSAFITFNNCIDSGAKFNGAISVSAVAVNGTIGVGSGQSINATLSFANFKAVEGSVTDTFNGNLTLAITRLDNVVFNANVTGTSFSIDENGHGVTLTNFALSFQDNKSTQAYSYKSSGTINSAKLNGTATFDTLISFEGTGNANPSKGQMKVTGANASNLQFTVIDSTNVQMDVDANGDGSFETSIKATWSEIEGA